MLSDNIRRFSRESWEAAQKDLGEAGRAAQRELDRLTGDERSLMELALGTLPASDVASVPFDVLLGYARHALRLRERSPYCRNVPEDIFLHHVFFRPNGSPGDRGAGGTGGSPGSQPVVRPANDL